jgi:hypothetical protein
MDEEYTKERKRVTSSHSATSASDSAYTTDEEQSSLILSEGQEKSEEEEPGLWTLMREWKYILPTWMMMVLSLRNAFYVASASTQTSTLLLLNNSPSISSDSSFFNTFFNAALPLGGVVSMPISSWLLSRNKERDDIVLGFVMTMASIQMVFNLVPEFWSQLVATSLFAVVRSLKWSTFSEFMVKRYPLKHFGMLLGFCNLSVALATLAVHPLYLWGTNASLDEVTTWRYQHPWLLPNLLLLLLQIIAFSAPIYLFIIISRRRNRNGYGWTTKL